MDIVMVELRERLAEDNRIRMQAMAIQVADERSHHRVKDEALAKMTAANSILVEQLAAVPKSIPQILTPQLFTANILNVTPTTFVTNVQNNIAQTTHNMHNNFLNFINNTSTRILNMGEPPGPSEDIPQLSITGGPPQPPPDAPRLAIRDAPAYAPEPTPAILDRPRNVKDVKKPFVKKKQPKIIVEPKIIVDPRPKRPIFIVDPPPRRKPRKDPELADVLDMFDRQPKRARQGNRLRTVAA